MRNNALLLTILNLPSDGKLLFNPPDPEEEKISFLHEGYILEEHFIAGKKIVTWFWQPGEMVIPTSPVAGLVALTEVSAHVFKIKDILQMLRSSEDAREIFRKLRAETNQKIEARVRDMKTLLPVEQYTKLIQEKPWVIEKVTPAQIASYVGTSEEALHKMMSKN